MSIDPDIMAAVADLDRENGLGEGGVSPATLKLLAQDTPRAEVRQRQGNKQHGGDCDKQYGVCQLQHRMLDYVDARYVMDLLDRVIGPENWQSRHYMEGEKVACSIGINVVGIGWVWKTDGAGESDIEGEKGSFSGALKRAAVSWSVARDLYPKPDAPSPAGRVVSPPARPATKPIHEGMGDDDVPEQDEDFCPDHGLHWERKPGGVSQRTGKAYDPFWACPSRDKPYCTRKPTREWVAAQ